MPPDFEPKDSPVHRTPLRLLPLCLAIAGAVRAEDTVQPTWLLCANPQTLPLLAEQIKDPGPR